MTRSHEMISIYSKRLHECFTLKVTYARPSYILSLTAELENQSITNPLCQSKASLTFRFVLHIIESWNGAYVIGTARNPIPCWKRRYRNEETVSIGIEESTS